MRACLFIWTSGMREILEVDSALPEEWTLERTYVTSTPTSDGTTVDVTNETRSVRFERREVQTIAGDYQVWYVQDAEVHAPKTTRSPGALPS
jgi:hypothetical protein